MLIKHKRKVKIPYILEDVYISIKGIVYTKEKKIAKGQVTFTSKVTNKKIKRDITFWIGLSYLNLTLFDKLWEDPTLEFMFTSKDRSKLNIRWRAKELPSLVYPRYYVIPNYSMYAINKKGVLVNRRFKKVLKPSKDSNGYPKLLLRSDTGNLDTIRIHRAVMLTFSQWTLHDLEHMTIDHKDSNKQNPNFKNLEWVTRTENVKRRDINKRKRAKRLKS